MNIMELLRTPWLGVPYAIWFCIGIVIVVIIIVVRHPLRFLYETKSRKVLLEAGKEKTGEIQYSAAHTAGAPPRHLKLRAVVRNKQPS